LLALRTVAVYVHSLLVCLMMRRLLISILFPYTTLFRSDIADRTAVLDADRIERLHGGGAALLAKVAGVIVGDAHHVKAGLRERLDRKSTRLNSSHEWISYAVFCLKKKTKSVTITHPPED